MPFTNLFAILLALGLFLLAIVGLVPGPAVNMAARIAAAVCFGVDAVLAAIGLG